MRQLLLLLPSFPQLEGGLPSCPGLDTAAIYQPLGERHGQSASQIEHLWVDTWETSSSGASQEENWWLAGDPGFQTLWILCKEYGSPENIMSHSWHQRFFWRQCTFLVGHVLDSSRLRLWVRQFTALPRISCVTSLICTRKMGQPWVCNEKRMSRFTETPETRSWFCLLAP